MVVKFKIYLCQKVERREIRYKVKQQGNVRTRNKLTERDEQFRELYTDNEICRRWEFVAIFFNTAVLKILLKGVLYTLKNSRPPELFFIYIYILHLLIFIMLEIKTNTFKIFICFKITIINPLPFSISIFSVKK